MTTPVITRAFVSAAHPSTIEMHFDSSTLVSSLIGVSLSFSVGTPKTLASFTGPGSTVWLLQASGPFDPTDNASIVIVSPNGIAGNDGSALAPVTFAIENGALNPASATNGHFVDINHASSATVLGAWQTARVDVSGGAPPSITMPPTSAITNGVQVTVRNEAGSFATTACPVTANTGQTIEDPNSLGTYSSTAGSVSLTVFSAVVTWEFNSTLARWKMV